MTEPVDPQTPGAAWRGAAMETESERKLQAEIRWKVFLLREPRRERGQQFEAEFHKTPPVHYPTPCCHGDRADGPAGRQGRWGRDGFNGPDVASLPLLHYPQCTCSCCISHLGIKSESVSEAPHHFSDGQLMLLRPHTSPQGWCSVFAAAAGCKAGFLKSIMSNNFFKIGLKQLTTVFNPTLSKGKKEAFLKCIK